MLYKNSSSANARILISHITSVRSTTATVPSSWPQNNNMSLSSTKPLRLLGTTDLAVRPGDIISPSMELTEPHSDRTDVGSSTNSTLLARELDSTLPSSSELRIDEKSNFFEVLPLGVNEETLFLGELTISGRSKTTSLGTWWTNMWVTVRVPVR